MYKWCAQVVSTYVCVRMHASRGQKSTLRQPLFFKKEWVSLGLEDLQLINIDWLASELPGALPHLLGLQTYATYTWPFIQILDIKLETLCLQCVLVTFCGAMIKCLGKSNSRKEGLFLPIVPGFSLPWQGSHSGRNFKLMATLCLQL